MTPRYPPIGDYALLSDCHCSALVSRHGSVDWCCMPRADDDSCFGRLLDWDKGGHCSIYPAGDFTTEWQYVPGTMILETRFRTDTGVVQLTDFLAMNAPQEPYFDLVRIVDGLEGEVELCVEVSPRYDYGEIFPFIRRHGPHLYSAIGSNQGLLIRADMPLDMQGRGTLGGRVRLRAGERVHLALQFEFPERVDQAADEAGIRAAEIDRYLESTRQWWSGWTARMCPPCKVDRHTARSAIVLKGLTYEPTGAIIAAPTTSLPEWPGGERNWDYRFSWVRDSVFTIRVLHTLGYVSEADGFHRFIQRSAAGSAEQLQIMYGVDGNRRLPESTLDGLEGYRGSKPVRIGNAAAGQTQLDIYGELLEMAWQWHCRGHATEADYWSFLSDVVDTVCARWSEADHGIWEVRGEPSHHVHSKVMCWAALNRGLQLAQENGFDAPFARWERARDAIRAAVERRGYDAERGVFVQAFDGTELDAALLLLPRVDFVAYDDPRMMRTVDAICETLDKDGLLLRYRGPDGLPGPEGMFLPCTFWLVACLARQGRKELAQVYYDRCIACSNELALFSEEYDMQTRQMLGNYPQGLTHVSQIMAWLALQDED